MTNRTNTLAVQVVAYGKANKDLDEVSRAFKTMKAESQHLSSLPKAADDVSGGFMLMGRSAGKSAVSMNALAIAGTAVAGTLTGAVAGIFELAKSSADAGEKAFEAAQRLGVSTEYITQMGFAARQSGSDQAALERGLLKLAKGAATGSKAFERWQVATHDSNGALKSTEELLVAAADRISTLESNTQRAAAAQDLFGRGGAELIPLLSEGAAGIDAMRERADYLGITIDHVSAELGAKFNDELAVTQEALGASAREIGSVFQPAMIEGFASVQGFASDLTRTIKENREEFETFATKTVSVVAKGFAAILEFGSPVREFYAGLAGFVSSDLGDAFDSANAILRSASDAARDLGKELEDGVATTEGAVIPSVNAENDARDDLIGTLRKERRARKELNTDVDAAAYALAESELALREEFTKTSEVGVREAVRLAQEKRKQAEATAQQDLANAEIIDRQIRESSALSKKERAEQVESLKVAREEIEKSTRAVIEAKAAESRAVAAANRENRQGADRKARDERRAERDRKRAMRSEARDQKAATEASIENAKAMATVAADTSDAMIGLFQTLRDENASTGDVIVGLAGVVQQTTDQMIGFAQQQMVAKQSAATGEITADAARGAAGVSASATENLPWFVALAVVPVVSAAMFGLIKAFAGKYHTGGILPGLPGEESLFMGLGGEQIRTPQQQRAEERSGGGRPTIINNISAPIQTMVGHSNRAGWDRQFRDSLGPAMQGLSDANQVRLRRNSRVIGRRRL